MAYGVVVVRYGYGGEPERSRINEKKNTYLRIITSLSLQLENSFPVADNKAHTGDYVVSIQSCYRAGRGMATASASDKNKTK